VKATAPTNEGLAAAVAVLRRGGIVALPTETYYGLAVDPFNPEALRRLFVVKRRSSDKPVLVLIEDDRHLARLIPELPPGLRQLAQRFWPGPLTLVCPARPDVPRLLTGNSGTVGLRRSSHPLAARLVRSWDGPLTATSANLSGQPPARDAAGVVEQFGDDIDLLLDGGPSPGGAPSTLVGLRDDGVVLLRAGAVDYTMVQECLGQQRP